MPHHPPPLSDRHAYRRFDFLDRKMMNSWRSRKPLPSARTVNQPCPPFRVPWHGADSWRPLARRGHHTTAAPHPHCQPSFQGAGTRAQESTLARPCATCTGGAARTRAQSLKLLKSLNSKSLPASNSANPMIRGQSTSSASSIEDASWTNSSGLSSWLPSTSAWRKRSRRSPSERLKRDLPAPCARGGE